MEDDRIPRVRGKRPPQGEPVIDRALSLLSAFDAMAAVAEAKTGDRTALRRRPASGNQES